MPRVRGWLRGLGAVVVLLFPGPLLSSAQTVSEYQVKAAYLYNFAKFVGWPARDFASATAPFRFCVLDDQSFQSELTRIVRGKTVSGRQSTVVAVQNAEQSRNCHILFVSAAHAAEASRIIEVLRDTSVLTVGESGGFVEAGGIINFVVNDSRVQFQVNHKAANDSGLLISSRLLTVATRVIE